MKLFLDFAINFAINLLVFLQFFIFLAVVFSWFPQSQRNAFVQFVLRIVAPLFRFIPPIRIGILDLTPLVVLGLVQILANILASVSQKVL